MRVCRLLDSGHRHQRAVGYADELQLAAAIVISVPLAFCLSVGEWARRWGHRLRRWWLEYSPSGEEWGGIGFIAMLFAAPWFCYWMSRRP